MWKLLSGIALILALDIVFIWMMSLEADAPEIARAVGPVAASPVIHSEQALAPTAVDDSTEPLDGDSDATREPQRRLLARREAAQPTRRFNRGSATAAVTAPVKLFQDTIIWIGRTEVPVKVDRESYDVRNESPVPEEIPASVSKAEPREVKKRSFQSKAIGVIKRPYDLIKAFADKIN